MYRGLLITYESQLADAEDLVENRRDEQNSEPDYNDKEDWIYHPTRVFRHVRQMRFSATMPRASIILISSRREE